MLDSLKEKAWEFIKKHVFITIIIVFLLLVLLVRYLESHDIDTSKGLKVSEKAKITILLEFPHELPSDNNEKFMLNNKECTKTENTNAEYICEKPVEGTYVYKYGSKKAKTILIDNKNAYNLIIDSSQYIVSDKESSLKLEKKSENYLVGDFVFIDENKGHLMLNNNEKKVKFKMCESVQEGEIKNGTLNFKILWKDFYRIYHRSCMKNIVLELQDKNFKYKKPFFITDDMEITDLFSISSQNTIDSPSKDLLKKELQEIIKIKNNELVFLPSKKNYPTLTLFEIPFQKNTTNNFYLKLRIKNINLKTTFSFYIAGEHIFRFNYPNLIFEDNELSNTRNKSNIESILSSNEKIQNNIIKDMVVVFVQENNKLKISLQIDKNKPIFKEFDNSSYIKEKKLVSHQIFIEKQFKNQDANLFSITDVESGEFYTNNNIN